MFPNGLETPESKLIYLYLSENGPASMTDLHYKLDLSYLTLTSLIELLRDRDIIQFDGGNYEIVV